MAPKQHLFELFKYDSFLVSIEKILGPYEEGGEGMGSLASEQRTGSVYERREITIPTYLETIVHVVVVPVK